MEVRTSKDLKKELASHLYWRLQYQVVCDEFQFADIVGIRKTGYVTEFEIKVSKSDFDRELKCITTKDCQKYGKDWEKFSKHRLYLTGELPQTDYDKRMSDLGYSTAISDRVFRPNEFYFYIPDYLVEHAVEKTLDLPYGIVAIGQKFLPNSRQYIFDRYNVVKKAVKLHNEKAGDILYRQLAHALTIRSRLFN